jgi:2-polyprenyl-3-methyl-5-hydroxy-6-metoxy-1,4-benzoquinol methylase
VDDRTFWNEAYKDNPEGTMVTDRILEAETAHLRPGRALDLGCGTGRNALALAARGWSVTGVDWAEHAISLAKESAVQHNLSANFIAADIRTWQPDAPFDLVINTYALPGGEDGERVLQTAAAALAPGGTLLITEWDRSMAAAWDFDKDELPTPGAIAAMLPDLIIEVAEVRRFSDMFTSPDDPRGSACSSANVAFIRARKPA